jgi:dGTPase
MVEDFLLGRGIIDVEDKGNIPSIVTAACLAHDIGNPPFGHAGENSISEYFHMREGSRVLAFNYQKAAIEGYDSYFEIKDVPEECKVRDLKCFEGNAMGFRLLTKSNERSLNLTCATLATFTKYPRQSYIDGELLMEARWSPRISQKKYGFFQTELSEFEAVANEVGLKRLRSDNGNNAWARHPLSFLMEAADDICYRIIDLEDGYRIQRVPFEEAAESLFAIARLDKNFNEGTYNGIKGNNEKFSYLRSKSINYLVFEVYSAFINNYESIITFEFDSELLKTASGNNLQDKINNMKKIVETRIYKWQDVLGLEASGFEILGGLIEKYIQASDICLGCPPSTRSKHASKIFDLLPEEYQHSDKEEPYTRYLKIASYVSGMTDTYAVNLFQKIKGIKIK